MSAALAPEPAAGRRTPHGLEPLTVFYAAEPEHHDYFARNSYSGYCQFVVAPKVFSEGVLRPAEAQRGGMRPA